MEETSTGRGISNGITISMDGKGRWADNIGAERFWRTYKHDCFLLNEVNSLEETQRLTASWLTYYNQERPHARLGNLSPSEYCRQKGYPPGGEFFCAIFPLRYSSRCFAPRPRYARDAVSTLQNRAKNGLTDHSSLCYKNLILIRAKKQEEMACSCQKEVDSLLRL